MPNFIFEKKCRFKNAKTTKALHDNAGLQARWKTYRTT